MTSNDREARMDMDEKEEFEKFLNGVSDKLLGENAELVQQYEESVGQEEGSEELVKLLSKIQQYVLRAYVDGYRNGDRVHGERLYYDAASSVIELSMEVLSCILGTINGDEDDIEEDSDKIAQHLMRDGDVIEVGSLNEEQLRELSGKTGIPVDVLRSGRVGICVEKGVTIEQMLSDSSVLVPRACKVVHDEESPDGWDIDEEQED